MRITDNTGKSKGPYISIENTEYVDGYRILITFSDGISRLVDFGEFLRNARHPDIRKYLDLKNFLKFKVIYGNLEWPNLDIAFPVSELHRGKIEFSSAKNSTLKAMKPSQEDIAQKLKRKKLVKVR